MEQVTFQPTFDDWQRAARGALQRDLAPENVVWQELLADQPALDIFDELDAPDPQQSGQKMFRVPKAFVELARVVALHRDQRRWALLYRILWRLTHGEPKLLEIAVDPDVALAFEFQKAIR
ncbi:MAG TPA: hypothetical protein VF551_00555, partial [Chthoniobacterales bacterium]